MKARYLVLGFLLIGIALAASPEAIQATGGCTLTPSGVGNPHVWDRSSLYFSDGCSGDCDSISATVCNGADSGRMLCPSSWELYYAARGNPKRGEVVASGTIPALLPGQCHVMSADPDSSGNYMFRALQAEGHPGTGELWSNSCSVNCR
jgi:YqxM protein